MNRKLLVIALGLAAVLLAAPFIATARANSVPTKHVLTAEGKYEAVESASHFLGIPGMFNPGDQCSLALVASWSGEAEEMTEAKGAGVWHDKTANIIVALKVEAVVIFYDVIGSVVELHGTAKVPSGKWAGEYNFISYIGVPLDVYSEIDLFDKEIDFWDGNFGFEARGSATIHLPGA